MACATLKRAIDWESLNQIPSKRRRCNPFGHVTDSPPRSARLSNTSTTGGGCSSSGGGYDVLGAVNQSPSSSRNYGREMTARDMSATPSVFSEAHISKISPDKMARDIRDEIKRLHKRKQLSFSTAAIERMQDSESSGSEMGPDSPRRPDSPPSIVRNPDKALFTFKQVQLICERMLKEREEEIREKYDTVLNTKLAEQYDAFVKFTYDQIQKRYDSAPSYLS